MSRIPELIATPSTGDDAPVLAQPVSRQRRPAWRSVARAVAVGTCLVAPLVLVAAVRERAVFDGVFAAPDLGHWGSSGVRITRVVDTRGIRVGDTVTAVDGRPLASWVTHPSGARSLRVGQRVEYDLRTPSGEVRRVDVTLRHYPLGKVLGGFATLPALVALELVAAVVFFRRSDKRAAHAERIVPGSDDLAARLVLLLAVALPLVALEWPAGIQVIDLAGGQGVVPLVIGDVAAAFCWALLLHFAMVFPRPLPLVRRHRWIVPLVYIGPFALYVARLPLVLGASSDLGRLSGLVEVSIAAARLYPVLTIVALAVGYRRASDAESRRGLRWIVGGAGITGFFYFGLILLPTATLGHPLIPTSWAALTLTLVPLSVGAGILRYRLLDVEVFARRSLVYAAITAATLLIFVLAIWLLDRWLRQGLVLLIASGAVALLVVSLRDRSQYLLSHLIFGDRSDPYRLISRIAQIDTARPPHRVLANVAQTIADALRLRFVAIVVPGPDGVPETAAEVGTPQDSPLTLTLTHGDHAIGNLVLDTGSRREPFGRADEAMLNDLARHVGAALHAVSLTLALQRSRERLVAAREEERRRVRRDLHDGLGPALAAIAMQLEAAENVLTTDPALAKELLARVHTEAGDAIADIRRLVDDLRPPTLDQLGLVSAIRERAATFRTSPDVSSRCGLDIVVRAEGDFTSLPAAVEVAAYRIAVEALTNVARHADATRCNVTLRLDSALHLEVSDNGQGLPEDVAPHVGLASMRERADELGGHCTITSNRGGGTTVRADIPCPR